MQAVEESGNRQELSGSDDPLSSSAMKSRREHSCQTYALPG